MRLRRVVTLGILLTASYAEGSTVDFTALTLTPSGTLTIDGVTITGQNGATVGTVTGEGLGIADYGSAGSFDKTIAYNSTGLVPGTATTFDGFLSILVDGRIDSITLKPYFVYDGPEPQSVPLPGFPFAVTAVGPQGEFGAFRDIARLLTDPVTFTFLQGTDIDGRPAMLRDVGFFIDFTWDSVFRNYWLSLGQPDLNFTFGVSITSLSYTPNVSTPEPATWALLIAGGMFVLRRHRPTVPRRR